MKREAPKKRAKKKPAPSHYKCSVCGKKFPYAEAVSTHQYMAHNDAGFVSWVE